MTQQTTQIPVTSIILDETIYPGKGIDPKRVGIFSVIFCSFLDAAAVNTDLVAFK